MGSLQLPHPAEEQGRVLLGDPILNKMSVKKQASFGSHLGYENQPSSAEVSFQNHRNCQLPI